MENNVTKGKQLLPSSKLTIRHLYGFNPQVSVSGRQRSGTSSLRGVFQN